MKQVIVGGIIIQDEKILLVQEAQKICYKQWNFPAGRLDAGETLAAGAARETEEETGFAVEPESLALIHSPTNHELLFFLFNMKILSGEIKFDKSEILDVRWVPLDEVKKLDLRIGIKQIFDEVLQRYRVGENYPLNLIVDNDISTEEKL